MTITEVPIKEMEAIIIDIYKPDEDDIANNKHEYNTEGFAKT